MTLKLEQRLVIEWEWRFVGNIMKKIGFHTKWNKLIMEGKCYLVHYFKYIFLFFIFLYNIIYIFIYFFIHTYF